MESSLTTLPIAINGPPASRVESPISTLLEQTRAFADEVASRPNHGGRDAPVADLAHLHSLGVLEASLPCSLGGLGLGLEAATHRPLLEFLAILGSADLALGRIVEGHINALLLLHQFASDAQIGSAAEDCRQGRLFGVWNTGTPALMQVESNADGSFTLRGSKTFATGAEFVGRPIVTAELAGSGWQMTLPRMESSPVHFDRSFWHPLGMESTESYAVDFTGTVLSSFDLIGAPGDFYRDPLFRGGAIRFAAVQAGAILRLQRLLAAWLVEHRREEDPYQLARLGEVTLLAQQAVLWIERGARAAESSLFAEDPASAGSMVEIANMTRLAIERIATGVMQLVTISVGAHGLLQPRPFERILRNLTMYLRQPAPDQTLRSVAVNALRRESAPAPRGTEGFWSNDGR